MKLSRKACGKRRWKTQRDQKADGLRKYRFRPKFYRTPFGIVKYKTHPLFAP